MGGPSQRKADGLASSKQHFKPRQANMPHANDFAPADLTVAILLAVTMFSAVAFAEEPADDSPASMTKMPGQTFAGPLPKLTADQAQLSDLLQSHVKVLAGDIGERNVLHRPKELNQAADYVERIWTQAGYKPARQTYRTGTVDCYNLDCEIQGGKRPEEIVIIGAHYDSVVGCPGANDNGSGAAGLLALATQLAEHKPERTLRFVAFTNEEPPFFQTRKMGSWVYAKRCRERKENIVAMLSLETIGYFSDKAKSQQYPAPFNRFYPSTGNFIGFVGNMKSAPLVRQVVGSFRQHAQFPSEGGAIPSFIKGVGWSDHWSFWQEGYPALMATDTAPFRYPHYHRRTDTPKQLDYDRMARVVAGLEEVVKELTRAPEESQKSE
jgi:hypothetical protein